MCDLNGKKQTCAYIQLLAVVEMRIF